MLPVPASRKSLGRGRSDRAGTRGIRAPQSCTPSGATPHQSFRAAAIRNSQEGAARPASEKRSDSVLPAPWCMRLAVTGTRSPGPQDASLRLGSLPRAHPDRLQIAIDLDGHRAFGDLYIAHNSADFALRVTHAIAAAENQRCQGCLSWARIRMAGCRGRSGTGARKCAWRNFVGA